MMMMTARSGRQVCPELGGVPATTLFAVSLVCRRRSAVADRSKISRSQRCGARESRPAMTTPLAACVAKLAAELASDSLQAAAAAASTAASSPKLRWGTLRSGDVAPAAPLLSLERRLQRFTSLEEYRDAILDASPNDVAQVHEVAVTTLLTKAVALGDTIAFREAIASALVLTLSRSSSRFVDDALGRLLDSLSTSMPSATISTTLECVAQIASRFPAHVFHFHPALLKTTKKLLKHADAVVRADALRCLARALTPEAPLPDLPKILAKAASDKSPEVRAAVARCTLNVASPIGLLSQLLDDRQVGVRRAVAAAFAALRMPPETIVSRLLPMQRLLRDPDNTEAVDAVVNLLNNTMGMTAAQRASLSLGVLTQLVVPNDGASCKAASAIVRCGLVRPADSSGRVAIAKSVLSLAAGKHVLATTLSTVLDVLRSALVLLGGEFDAELEDALLELLLAALSNPAADVRMQAAGTLRALAQTKPVQATTVVRILQNVAAIHIAEVTLAAGDMRDVAAALMAMHGHCHALAAIVSILNELDAGIPDAILADLFKTGTSLAAHRDARSPVVAESAWVIIDALLTQGLTSTQLAALFPLWKLYLQCPNRQATTLSKAVGVSSVDLAAADIQSRYWALRALGTLVRCTGADALLRQPGILRPISALFSEVLHVVEMCRSKTVADPFVEDDTVRAALTRLKTVLLGIVPALPLQMLSSRLVPLLHLSVAELTSRSAPVTRCLQDVLNARDNVLDDDDNDDVSARSPRSPPSTAEGHGDGIAADAQRLVDAAIGSFAAIFKMQQAAHQVQLLTHFSAIVDSSLSSTSTVNVAAALLLTLRDLLGARVAIGDVAARAQLVAILEKVVASPAVLVRRIACEACGLLCRLEGSDFTSSFMDRQRANVAGVQSLNSITGSILVLANVHRHVGLVRTIAWLPVTITTLHSLFEYMQEPLRTTVLHTVAVLIDVCGSSFAPYARATLNLVMLQSLGDPEPLTPAVACILARLVRSIVEVLGPDIEDDPAQLLRKCTWLWRRCTVLAPSEAVEAVPPFLMWLPVPPADMVSTLKAHIGLPSLTVALGQIALQDCDFVIANAFDIDLLGALDRVSDPREQDAITRTLLSFVELYGCTHPDRWIETARSIVVSGRLPGASPEPAAPDAPNDDGVASTSSSTTSHVSWRTVSCAASCLARLVAIASIPLGKVRELVNLMCREASTSDDRIRASGLSGLATLVERYARVPDPGHPEDRLLQLDLSQMKAVVRQGLCGGPESTSPRVRSAACCACLRLLQSGLLDDDPPSMQRFVEALCTPLTDSGRAALLAAVSSAAAHVVQVGHLTAVAELVVGSDVHTLLVRASLPSYPALLSAALRDRLRIVALPSLQLLQSDLLEAVPLTRSMYDHEWPVHLRALAQAPSSNASTARLVVGVALQFLHTLLGGGAPAKVDDEAIARGCLDAICRALSSSASGLGSVEWDALLAQSLAVAMDSSHCSAALMEHAVRAGAALLASSAKRLPDAVAGGDDDEHHHHRGTLSAALCQIVLVQCARRPLDDAPACIAAFQLAGALVQCDPLRPLMQHAAQLALASLRALMDADELALVQAAAVVLIATVDCIDDRSLRSALLEQTIATLDGERDQPDLTASDSFGVAKINALGLVLNALLQRDDDAGKAAHCVSSFIHRCLTALSPSSRSVSLGLHLVRCLLRTSSSMKVLTAVTPTVLHLLLHRCCAHSLAAVTGLAISIENAAVLDRRGAFLAMLIPLFIRCGEQASTVDDDVDICAAIDQIAGAVGEHLRLAVASLPGQTRLLFQKCIEDARARKASSVQGRQQLSPDTGGFASFSNATPGDSSTPRGSRKERKAGKKGKSKRGTKPRPDDATGAASPTPEGVPIEFDADFDAFQDDS